MVDVTWGLLGPEFLPGVRRTRTLGLGASMRLFNDLAVPGLGGVWYGKQVLLATLGVAVAKNARAEGARVQNIEMANAIEALACWSAFEQNGWTSDPRLRGKTKLQFSGSKLSFSHVRKRSFYVTQPMRMATVQALPALGFVESNSARFNAFECTQSGYEFVDEALKAYTPFNGSVVDHLVAWVSNPDRHVGTDQLRAALSPLNPLSDLAIRLLREGLLHGGGDDARRRRDGLTWVEQIRREKPTTLDWRNKPDEISGLHWADLVAGARFFGTRQVAISVLDALEAHMGNQTAGPSHSLRTAVPKDVAPLLDDLRTAAQAFLDTRHSDHDANTFCSDCVTKDDATLLGNLVERDGLALRLVGDDVKPGPAFRGFAPPPGESETDEVEVDADSVAKVLMPPDISYRMHNLYLLNLDMHGELSQWLNPAAESVQQ